MAKQSLGATPRLWAAARKQSGAGLPLVTWHSGGTSVSAKGTEAISPTLTLKVLLCRWHPAAGCKASAQQAGRSKSTGVVMVAWAHHHASAACYCWMRACLLVADHNSNRKEAAQPVTGQAVALSILTAYSHLRSAHLIPAAHDGEDFCRPGMLPRQLSFQSGSAGAGCQRHRHSMLVQMPQQATCSRQELRLVPPAQKRQSLGVLCCRHTMLVQRLQQATAIWISISLVLCHLHDKLVVDFNALCCRNDRIVQVMRGHPAPCRTSALYLPPASQVCSHVMVVLCCAEASAGG